MPELPEVETVARQLRDSVRGQTLQGKRVFDEKLKKPLAAVRKGLVVKDVRRHGKQVLFEFEQGSYLSWHLRMTGRLGFCAGDAPDNIKRFCRARLSFDKGELYFSDVRRFGTCSYSDTVPDLGDAIDPVTASFTPLALKNLLGASKQNVKLFLMRQDKVVGVGNIYASEILFACKIHPERPCYSLSAKEIKALHQATLKILNKAIKNCGTTFSDFQDSYGELGKYQNFLKVYQRAGEPCKRCKSEIEKVVLGQRSTFYCPKCQK